jgi:hypothetical protein
VASRMGWLDSLLTRGRRRGVAAVDALGPAWETWLVWCVGSMD